MSDEKDEPREGRGDGALMRGVRAVEVLASAHASRAKEEARRDLGRIGSGVGLFALAALLAIPAVVLLHVALVIVLHERSGLPWATAAAAVAGGDVAIGALAILLGRARLRTPVMVETRATLKRAVAVLKG